MDLIVCALFTAMWLPLLLIASQVKWEMLRGSLVNCSEGYLQEEVTGILVSWMSIYLLRSHTWSITCAYLSKLLPLWLRWQRISLQCQETWVWILGQKGPLDKQIAAHSSILVWEIPWTEEPGGYSPWGCQESEATEWLTLSLHTRHTESEIARTVPSKLWFNKPSRWT